MYAPDLPKVLNSRSIVYLDKSSFTLDVSGVAGFFGGAEAVSAMATVHICRHRKAWGWYNSPGSYEIAKRYGLLTKFGFFFGGGHADPAELLALFELDGSKGPPFLRVHYGSIIPQTDHLAAVFMKKFSSPEYPKLLSQRRRSAGAATAGLRNFSSSVYSEDLQVPSKERQPVGVTIVELHTCPLNEVPLKPINTPQNSRKLAALPIIVSAGACVMCGVVQDWFAFSLILLGIIANGLSCLAIGSSKLVFMRPQLAGEPDPDPHEKHHHPGPSRRVSGILYTATEVVLLKGREDAAMAVAQSKFAFPLHPRNKSIHRFIGFCSVLLLIQFFAQLLVIPQASLFGQILFVTTLGASWCYNLLLCSVDKTDVQQRILLEEVLRLKEGDTHKYQLDNWPAMVVFVLLTLALEDDEIEVHELEAVLNTLIGDTSQVWVTWRSALMGHVTSLLALKRRSALSRVSLDVVEGLKVDGGSGWPLKGVSPKMNVHLDEAQSGMDMFKERFRHIRSLSDQQHYDAPSLDHVHV